MQGAREYAKLFSSGQRGRLYFVVGEHARGKTFSVWVLPSAAPITGMPWAEKDAVEVYGITGGQPGWTETYGWLHRGRWEQDFAAMVEARRAEIAEASAKKALGKEAAEAAEKKRIAALLSNY